MHNSAPDKVRYNWLTYDLNGDGKEELLAQLNWCGSGGCTLLIFENHQDKWRFNSRITLVRTPIDVSSSSTNGWRDLLFTVSGGGAKTQQHLMQYSGVSYPLNPSTAPVEKDNKQSDAVLFSDGQSPFQYGLEM